MNNVILRRINFLLETAKHEDKKDQAVTYVMRVLSNYATIGKDAGSTPIKKKNRNVTKKAFKLLVKKGLSIYCKETINEHTRPLQQTWNWLKENKNLTTQDVWKEFCENKMVTVTKEEDTLIRMKGFNSKGTFKERYIDLGIEIIMLDQNPEDF